MWTASFKDRDTVIKKYSKIGLENGNEFSLKDILSTAFAHLRIDWCSGEDRELTQEKKPPDLTTLTQNTAISQSTRYNTLTFNMYAC